jgi:hypothetical protein
VLYVLFSAPKQHQEIGQVYCDSRVESPENWDDVVRRQRIGIYLGEEDTAYMELRATLPRQGNRPTRNTISLEELSARVAFDVSESLLRLGALRVGKKSELIHNSNTRTRNQPCVTFALGDILTPVSAWVSTTLATLI